jgi:hypothetical protein
MDDPMSDRKHRRPFSWSAIAAFALCVGPATGAGWGRVTCYPKAEPWRTVSGPLRWLIRESRIQSLCAPIDWSCNLKPAEWIPADPARIELMPRPAVAARQVSASSVVEVGTVAGEKAESSHRTIVA